MSILPLLLVSSATTRQALTSTEAAGLVVSERRATWVYFRGHPETVAMLADVLVPDGSPLRSSCCPEESDLQA